MSDGYIRRLVSFLRNGPNKLNKIFIIILRVLITILGHPGLQRGREGKGKTGSGKKGGGEGKGKRKGKGEDSRHILLCSFEGAN